MHNVKSFVKNGLTEWTTWIGILILVFLLLYYKEINQLIVNILTSPTLASKGVDGLTSVAAFGFILYKQKK